MRVPNAIHEARPWVMNEIAPDFTLMDVWALPVEGGADDFPAFLEVMGSIDPARADSAPTRALFWVRLRLGDLLGWDDTTAQHPIPGASETTLRDRLSEDLRNSAADSLPGKGTSQIAGFVPLYRTANEAAAEIANATVHGVLHLGWVEQPDGRFRGQLAVYVKPRGRLGQAYLLLISPFRHLVVYPALLRQIGRAWEARRSKISPS